jgi:thiamine biosynthesis lipoprotein
VIDRPLRMACAAMGTRFELVLQAQLCAAGEAALDEIARWDQLLNRFAPDSLVSHINRTAAFRPVRLDRDTFALFKTALDVWRASGGAFDITVAPLMARNGFADSSVAARDGRVGSDALVLDEREWSIRFSRPGTSLDLGGIAKGHALDCASAILRDAGVTSALIHGGTSSVIAIGTPPDDSGWRIAIRSAAEAPVVMLRDEALSVSDAGSQTSLMGHAHIVDPLLQLPAPDAGAMAVVGPSAAVAEAWSTALVVLGRVPHAFPSGYQCVAGAVPV